jgi:integrase/recombinase XerD
MNDWCEHWLSKNSRRIRLKGYSINTEDDYNRYLKAFLKAFPKHPLKITKEEIHQYLFRLSESKQYINSTFNNFVAALRFFYEQTMESPELAQNFLRKKMGTPLPTVLSVEEVRRLFEATHHIKNRLLIKAGYGFGLRVGSAVSLKVHQFDFDRGVLKVEADKGKKDRYVSLSQAYTEELKRYLNAYTPTPYLFPGTEPGKPLSRRTASDIMQQSLKAAGITKKASFHTLRHSYATHLHEQGVSIRTIQELMGHSKLKTTEKYIHVSTRDIIRAGSPLDRI